MKACFSVPPAASVSPAPTAAHANALTPGVAHATICRIARPIVDRAIARAACTKARPDAQAAGSRNACRLRHQNGAKEVADGLEQALEEEAAGVGVGSIFMHHVVQR